MAYALLNSGRPRSRTRPGLTTPLRGVLLNMPEEMLSYLLSAVELQIFSSAIVAK